MTKARRQRVICVLGGARTGTHLLNALLCSSPKVMPLLPESVPVHALVEAFRVTRLNLERFPGGYFETDEDLRTVYADALRSILDGLRRRYRRPIVVLRQPALTRLRDELRELLIACDQRPQFLVTVRDPRDAVASMLTWERKRLRRGGPPFAPGQDRPRALAGLLLSYYGAVLGGEQRDTTFVRYEDVVARTEEVAETLRRVARLQLEPEAHWEDAQVDFHGGPETMREAITKLYGAPISEASVGRWKGRLGRRQGEAVLEVCSPLVRRFYPELLA